MQAAMHAIQAHLQQACVVPDVKELHAAHISVAIHPAAHHHWLPHILLTQSAGSLGTAGPRQMGG
jgi:hypothetical protein